VKTVVIVAISVIASVSVIFGLLSVDNYLAELRYNERVAEINQEYFEAEMEQVHKDGLEKCRKDSLLEDHGMESIIRNTVCITGVNALYDCYLNFDVKEFDSCTERVLLCQRFFDPKEYENCLEWALKSENS